MRLVDALLDLLAPPRCPACGDAAGVAWCGPCSRELAELALADRGEVDLAPGIRAVAAYAYEGAVRDTLLAVKVRGQHAVLGAMGTLLRARLELVDPPPGAAVTWVPASRMGRGRRGVDVARRLAGPAAVPLLRRVRETPEQKHLSARARRESPHGAFGVEGPVPPAVVLVDDVRTTGTTAVAAGSALRTAGARRVLVATFAAVPETPGYEGSVFAPERWEPDAEV